MFFERPEFGERSILVHLQFSRSRDGDDPRELEELVISAGADPVAFVTGQRAMPDPKYFVGVGKVEELQSLVLFHEAEVVIFNHCLSPSQERNLEYRLKCRVLDRTGLILDIFAQRARTHEGKLQVELAQLQHMSTRLIRGWTHLERQKGGIGLRGPGETQLETDRRLLRARIQSIETRLEKVRKQRHQGRRSRQRAALPTVSLVGYTNAGKSTLFNRLTDSEVYAEDQLFATLDPTMRRIELDTVGPVIMADTVGFISHLPHRLVEAFRATLEEASHASLLLHVIDAAAEERKRNIEQVELVLKEIQANSLPQLKIFNKLDLLPEQQPRIDRNELGKPSAVWLSAQTGEGLELLYQALVECLAQELVVGRLLIGANQGRLRAKLYAMSVIQSEQFRDDGTCELDIQIPVQDWNQLLASEAIDTKHLQWLDTAPTH